MIEVTEHVISVLRSLENRAIDDHVALEASGVIRAAEAMAERADLFRQLAAVAELMQFDDAFARTVSEALVARAAARAAARHPEDEVLGAEQDLAFSALSRTPLAVAFGAIPALRHAAPPIGRGKTPRCGADGPTVLFASDVTCPQCLSLMAAQARDAGEPHYFSPDFEGADSAADAAPEACVYFDQPGHTVYQKPPRAIYDLIGADRPMCTPCRALADDSTTQPTPAPGAAP